MRPLDLQGKLFGRLTALRLDTSARSRSWVCACSCGSVKTVRSKALLRGTTKSCGCLRADTTTEANITHGQSGTYTYKKWLSMWRRVRAPVLKSTCYAGVTVCERWKAYTAFLEDMGPCATGESLDRIDNAKGYSRDNCRWVRLSAQAANTSRNVYVEVDGAQVHLSEAARRVGLSPDVVFDRVNKLGWGVERALATPARKQNRKLMGVKHR